MLAESKGLVLRDYRQFWMGHKGDIENRYTTNKCRLPENVIEDMREAYRRSQEFLQTIKPETSRESLIEEFRRQLLLVAGFTSEEIDKIDVSGLSDEEFQEIVRKRLVGNKNEDCGTPKSRRPKSDRRIPRKRMGIYGDATKRKNNHKKSKSPNQSILKS